VKRAAILLVCALGCGRTQLTRAKPHADIDARAIDFGPTPVLFPVQHNLLVADGGRVPLHLTGIAVSGAAFEGPAATTLEVAAGATAQLKLVFRPPAPGAFAGTLSLATDDPALPALTIALSGVGTTAGALTATPAALAFGRVGEGQTATRQLMLQSTGAADLFLGGFGLAPGTPSSFDYVGSIKTPATLAAGSSVTLGVRFSPTPDTPAGTGALLIDSSDPAHPQLRVPVSGSINRAPIAVAQGSVGSGPKFTGSLDAAAGATVLLDASASSDPDGDLPLSFSWSLATVPVGSNAAIANPSAAQASLQLDAPGIYSVLLTATDALGLPSLSPARLDIRATAAQALVVELIWDQIPPDLDLHFLQSGAQLGSAGDCWWANPDPAWGPHHGGDKLTGYGPERVTWQAPAAGTYGIEVVYAAAHGAASPATTAQIRVYAQGVLAADLTHAFSAQGQVWKAGTVGWPSGQVGTLP
jgi:hypothetical protein